MKTILLADDSSVIRVMLKTTLVDYDIIEAEDGAEALDKARSNSVDLFILDVNMPELDGIRLTEALRREPKYSNTPIIIMTTESRENKKEEGKAVGATGWIVKPCPPEKLLSIVNRLL